MSFIWIFSTLSFPLSASTSTQLTERQLIYRKVMLQLQAGWSWRDSAVPGCSYSCGSHLTRSLSSSSQQQQQQHYWPLYVNIRASKMTAMRAQHATRTFVGDWQDVTAHNHTLGYCATHDSARHLRRADLLTELTVLRANRTLCSDLQTAEVGKSHMTIAREITQEQLGLS